jgi:hypothetical protein
MMIFLLSALSFFLLQFKNYTKGSRAKALKILEKSSRLRPVLEHYWLLSNLCTATAFAGCWTALHFHSISERGAAILCWIVFGFGAVGVALLSSLPDYSVMKAQNRRRAKRRAAGR